MKKTTLTFGLLSAALAIVLMAATVPLIGSMDMAKADLIGYTSMAVSAIVLFIGVRSYRERAGGTLSFGRGVGVGILITLISTVCYMAAFQVMYFTLVPDFGEKFRACMIERAKASGASPAEVDDTAATAATLKKLYDHPATNAALTFAMTFPLGLLMSVVAAAVLRRQS